jgi:hypothetical protein
MGTKFRDRLYGTSVRIAAERAAEARREADKLACEVRRRQCSRHCRMMRSTS